MKKQALLILSVLIIPILYFIVINKDSGTNVRIEKNEFISLKKQLIESKGDRPNEYLTYFKEVSTKYGETKPNYKPNYRINALNSALEQLYSNTSINAKTAALFEVTSRGPGNIGGRTRAIIVDPDDITKNTWYAGSASGGIWKTTNAGTTYKPIFDAQGSYSIGCVTIDPNNENIIFN